MQRLFCYLILFVIFISGLSCKEDKGTISDSTPGYDSAALNANKTVKIEDLVGDWLNILNEESVLVLAIVFNITEDGTYRFIYYIDENTSECGFF